MAQKRHSRQDTGGTSGKRRIVVPLVLLALAAGVVGLTIHMAGRKDASQGPDARGRPSSVPQVERVLARARDLIKAGDGRVTAAISAKGSGNQAKMKWARMAYEGARDLALSYVRAHPEDVEVRPVLAAALLRLGDYDRAAQVVDRVLRLAPRSAAGLWAKGEIHRLRGDGDHAKWFLAAAESPGADAAIWSRYGVWLALENNEDEAEEYLNKAYAAGSAETAVVSILGRIVFAKGRFERAEALLSQATEGDSPAPEDLALLAETRMNLGKPDEAARAVERALKIEKGPARGRLMMLLGKVRVQQKRQFEAARAFQAAAKYRLLRGEAAFRAAQSNYFAGKYALAMKFIDQAAQVRPGDGVVGEWVKKIEDARFGPPRPETKTGVEPPPFGRSGTPRALQSADGSR